LAASESELLSIGPQTSSLKTELASLSNSNYSTVLSLVRSLEVEVERAEVASNFASSKHLQVIEGWVLAQNYSELASLISKHSGSAYVEELGLDPHLESPPVILQNPKFAQPFEWITKNFSMPNYFEFDPTMAYFVALPIMYGMLVGDVVYGAMSIGISSWFMKKFKNNEMLANVSKIWFYSAIPSMIFGLIYDEWGGMTHFHLLEFIHSWTGLAIPHAPLYLGFPRIENAITLVAITAGLGMLHLTIGFILGALNEWNHNKKHAIAKLAWIGVEIGGLMALLSMMGITTSLVMTAGLGILGLSVAYLGYAEGLVGIIELPGLLGNILSYTRIAAVGIAGVVMAELINKFLLPTPEAGVFGLLLFPIFIAFHIINCFIAMFESIIQGARLNIVEFKSKFLHGGKEIFSPFMLKK
jgi:V/A-type H+-transporting ATPase subunit I